MPSLSSLFSDLSVSRTAAGAKSVSGSLASSQAPTSPGPLRRAIADGPSANRPASSGGTRAPQGASAASLAQIDARATRTPAKAAIATAAGQAGRSPGIDPARVEEAKQLDAGARHILERTDFLERIQGENVPPNFLILARRWGLLPEPKMDPLPLPRILQDIDDSREMLKELERLIPQTKSMETTLTHDAQATLAILDGLRAPFEELRLSLKQLDPDELGCTLPDQIDAAPLPEQSGNPAQRVVDWARDTQAMLAKVKDFYGASSAHWHLATVLDSEVADAMRDCNVQVLANAQGAEGFHAFAAPFVDAASAAHPMTRAVLLRPPKPSSTYRP